MTYLGMREFTQQERARLKALAVPTCPECDGDGIVAVTWNSRPDDDEEWACECVQRSGDEEESA